MIYLDSAATSFPKPRGILQGMTDFYAETGVTPGRSGSDLALEAGAMVDETRRELHAFFGNPDPDSNRLVFCANATDALNLALQGVLNPGDHALSTCLEHNSVLRPLQALAKAGRIVCDHLPFNAAGRVEASAVAAAIRPDTRLLAITHSSNVLGSVQDLHAIGRVCRERGVLLLVDAAQSAGLLEIDMAAMHIDLLAFTGHKALLGPTGSGGLAVGPDVPIRSSRWGGTGVDSADPDQPKRFPYRLEAGTPNLLGIAGLKLGLAHIREKGRETLLAQELALRARFCEGAGRIRGLRLLGPIHADALTPVVGCLLTGMSPEEAGNRLDVDYGITIRSGLHCAPLVHRALGTFPEGALRFSFGWANSDADIDQALEALDALARIAARR